MPSKPTASSSGSPEVQDEAFEEKDGGGASIVDEMVTLKGLSLEGPSGELNGRAGPYGILNSIFSAQLKRRRRVVTHTL